MADNDSIAGDLSGTGLEEITFKPNDTGEYPSDTIGDEMSETRLDDDEVTEIIHELETYKVIDVQGGEKLAMEVPMEEVAKDAQKGAQG